MDTKQGKQGISGNLSGLNNYFHPRLCGLNRWYGHEIRYARLW